MKVQEFIKQLKQGKIAPVYLITGGEAFLIQNALGYLLEACLDPSARDFNYIQLDGKGCTSDSVLNEVQSHPVFSDRRLVVLKNAEAMAAPEANHLLGYLKDPSPTTCFAIVAQNPDMRRTFFQTLIKRHPKVECDPLPEGLLPAWMHSEARSLGYTLSEEATGFLIEQIGSDLFRLHNEIIKASLITGPDKKITQDELLYVISSGEHGSIPDLLDAVGRTGMEKALIILKGLLESGDAPLLILGSLARHFRQILKVKQLLLNKVPEAAIQKKLNIWRSIWPKVLRQAKTFGMEDLLFACRRITETDAGIKGAVTDNPLLMEMLVMDLCAGKKGGLRQFLGRQDLIYLERQV